MNHHLTEPVKEIGPILTVILGIISGGAAIYELLPVVLGYIVTILSIVLSIIYIMRGWVGWQHDKLKKKWDKEEHAKKSSD